MTKKMILIITLSLCANSDVHSRMLSSLSYQGGYSSNLFNDSLNTTDVFNSLGGAVQLYPSNSIELESSGYYSHYSENSDLSNLYGNASVKAIYDSYTSDFSVLAGGNLYFQKYGELFSIYDYWSANTNINGMYRAMNSLSFSCGGYLTYMKYTQEESVTNNEMGHYGGCNLTLPGENKIDCEVQLYRKKFNNLLDLLGGEQNLRYDFIDLNLVYAKSISESISLQIAYLHRSISDKQFSVIGYTIDYLSPWSSLWDGDRFSTSIKKYFKNDIILVVYGSYFEKSYVPVVEYDPARDVRRRIIRADENIYTTISITKNVYFTKTILSPTVEISYSDNRSNDSMYVYDKILVLLSLTYGF